MNLVWVNHKSMVRAYSITPGWTLVLQFIAVFLNPCQQCLFVLRIHAGTTHITPIESKPIKKKSTSKRFQAYSYLPYKFTQRSKTYDRPLYWRLFYQGFP